MIITAVDPGLSGAVVSLDTGRATPRSPNLLELGAWSLELELKAARDFKSIQQLTFSINLFARWADHVVIEDVHALPGEGVCSSFSFGRSLGAAEAAIHLALLSIGSARPTGLTPLVRVHPLKWQNFWRKLLNIQRPWPFDSPQIAAQVFPRSADLFKRKKDHNTADAALIAAWWLLNNVAPGVSPEKR